MRVKRVLGLTFIVHQTVFGVVFGWTLGNLDPTPYGALSFFLVSPLVPLACWLWIQAIPNVLVWQDGTPMDKLGLANHLTLFRLGSMPALSYLLFLSKDYPSVIPLIAVWSGLAFLTDLSDGFLSRKLNQISRFGKALDSTSDYLLLVSLLVVLTGLNLLPLWLLTLGLIRLVFQMVAMGILMWRKRGLILETTLLGKAAVFALMSCLFAHLVHFLLRVEVIWLDQALRILDWATALILVLSLFDKLLYFHRTWRGLQTPRA